MRKLLLPALWILLASPLSAYTIMLKDGGQVIVQGKYTIEGEYALAYLPSGAQTRIALSEIDVARTERMNSIETGSAYVIDGSGEARPLEHAQPVRQKTLGDILRERGDHQLDLDRANRAGDGAQEQGSGTNLYDLARTRHDDDELRQKLIDAMTSDRPRDVKVFRGLEPDRALIEVTTDDEDQVFSAIDAAAGALIRSRAEHPNLAGIELVLSTSESGRAGQFIITPEAASRLRDGRTTPQRYFVDSVIF